MTSLAQRIREEAATVTQPESAFYNLLNIAGEVAELEATLHAIRTQVEKVDHA